MRSLSSNNISIILIKLNPFMKMLLPTLHSVIPPIILLPHYAPSPLLHPKTITNMVCLRHWDGWKDSDSRSKERYKN